MSWNDRSRRRLRRRGVATAEDPGAAVASAAVGSVPGRAAGDATGPVQEPAARTDPGTRGNSRPAAPSADRLADRAAHRMYAEVVWSTLDRLPLVAPGARTSTEAQLIALCRRLDIEPVAVKVSATRARLVLRFKPAHSIGAVVTSLKLGSQDAAMLAGRPIRWAPGFACLTLSVTEIRRRALRLRIRD